MTILLGPASLTFPQSAHTNTSLPDGKPIRLTTYAGILAVGYGTGGGKFISEEYLHPLCAVGPVLVPPVSHLPSQAAGNTHLLTLTADDGFHSAIASVSLADIWMKPGDGVTSILTARADLWDLTIFPSGGTVRAVALGFTVHGKNSEIYTVSYRVDVLATGYAPVLISEQTGIQNTWDGRFSIAGQSIVRPGQPQVPQAF